MDITTVTKRDLERLVASFAGPNTRRISDYLAGYQLGPSRNLTIRDASGNILSEAEPQSTVSYWAGDLLPASDPRYAKQIDALRRSFTFRNLIRECVETLVDGIGIDEPDWSLSLARPIAQGESPSTEEAALISEAESLLTTWWDSRNIPALLVRAAVLAVAHGRQPIRPRVPARFRSQDGRLTPRPAPASLDGLYLELPDIEDSGIYTDPNTLERYGVTRITTDRPGGGVAVSYEIGRVDETGRSVLRVVSADGTASESQPVDLGGTPWLFEMRFWRGAVTNDVITLQDAFNVGLTNLSRNTRWAAFEKLIAIGVDPPLSESGEPVAPAGPGTASYLQPTVSRETEVRESNEGPVEIVREKMFAGAKVDQIQPSEPKAIQALIDQARGDIYGAMWQSFREMNDQATASGRSREVATGSFLRATARYGVSCEHLIRELLQFALKFAGLTQGQPGRYDALRVTVTCRQQVFEPSPETITAMFALLQGGVISLQTMRTIAGVADPDAEAALIERETTTTPAAE